MAKVNYQDKGLNKGYGSIALRLNQEVVINFNDCIIENTICLRFPHLLEQINEILDDKSLTNCKEVSRIMCSITENQESGRFFTKRVIQSYIDNSWVYEEEWRIVLNKLEIKRLREFEVLVKGFYKGLEKSRREFRYILPQFQWSPLHIAAERGHIDFCKWIAKFSTIKCYQWSPLHFSVQAGWLEVSKFLYKEIEEKYTTRIFYGVQHLAAKNGHLDIYRFLHESLNDINPIMQEHITPLHLAAQCGHFDVCKYICDNTVMVAPFRSDFLTPYNLAKYRGHFKVANLLNERDTTPNIIGNVPNTFLILLILVYIFIFICLFFGLDLLQYQFSGVSRTFNRPIKSNVQDFLIIFLLFPKLAVLLIDTAKNVRFSLISPKLDY